MEKSIDVLKTSVSHQATVVISEMTTLVASDFFTVIDGELTGKAGADYSLLNVLAGKGEIDGRWKGLSYSKGSHYLTDDVESWTFGRTGLKLIVVIKKKGLS